ncbi:hypothetical protein ACD578_26530 (plasmid) [Microvirga sp. RSM25]|uniref:hypothetical protein n=1 Tax=Microvirga sp. RSM25 TaxID=3273802 RepID=UPI00384B3753
MRLPAGVEAAISTSERKLLDIRHGSQTAGHLFETAFDSEIMSFEGGGITYNLRYTKKVPPEHLIASWGRIDHLCGAVTDQGIIVSREMFGTLISVLNRVFEILQIRILSHNSMSVEFILVPPLCDATNARPSRANPFQPLENK